MIQKVGGVEGEIDPSTSSRQQTLIFIPYYFSNNTDTHGIKWHHVMFSFWCERKRKNYSRGKYVVFNDCHMKITGYWNIFDELMSILLMFDMVDVP